MNTLYDDARYKMMNGAFNWTTKDLVLTAWSGTPVFTSTHKTIANVVSAGFTDRGASLPVTAKTVTSGGVGQSNPVVIPAVPIGPNVTWFTLADRKATYSQSELILFVDDTLGLPFVANGLDIVVQPDWAAQRGWFRP